MNAGIATANSPSILGKSYTITAEVTVPEGGGNGVIVTTGARWGGYGPYLLNSRPVFNYNMLILAQYRWEGQESQSRPIGIALWSAVILHAAMGVWCVRQLLGKQTRKTQK